MAFYVLTVKCLIVSEDQIQFRVHVRPVRVRLNLIFCSSGKVLAKSKTQPQSETPTLDVNSNLISARTFQPMKMDLSSTQTDFDKQLEMVQQQQLKEIVLFHFKMRFQPIRAQDLK